MSLFLPYLLIFFISVQPVPEIKQKECQPLQHLSLTSTPDQKAAVHGLRRNCTITGLLLLKQMQTNSQENCRFLLLLGLCLRDQGRTSLQNFIILIVIQYPLCCAQQSQTQCQIQTAPLLRDQHANENPVMRILVNCSIIEKMTPSGLLFLLALNRNLGLFPLQSLPESIFLPRPHHPMLHLRSHLLLLSLPIPTAHPVPLPSSIAAGPAKMVLSTYSPLSSKNYTGISRIWRRR